MAGKEGNGPRERNHPVKKKRGVSPLYFYYGDPPQLHKRLHVDRGADLVTCWNFPEHKTVAYSWSEVRRLSTRAYSTGEVCKLLNRSRLTILRAIYAGNIRTPYRPYTLDERKVQGNHRWSEKDIMDARDYFSTVHIGFPRKDGRITTRPIPTKVELRAMLSQGITMYVRTSDGEFVPVFKETDW
jgi:hypothetical protein